MLNFYSVNLDIIKEFRANIPFLSKLKRICLYKHNSDAIVCDISSTAATPKKCYQHLFPPTCRFFFVQKVGDWLDVRDMDGTWRVAQVVRIEGESLRAHFQGYTSRYDEDIRLESSKV